MCERHDMNGKIHQPLCRLYISFQMERVDNKATKPRLTLTGVNQNIQLDVGNTAEDDQENLKTKHHKLASVVKGVHARLRRKLKECKLISFALSSFSTFKDFSFIIDILFKFTCYHVNVLQMKVFTLVKNT